MNSPPKKMEVNKRGSQKANKTWHLHYRKHKKPRDTIFAPAWGSLRWGLSPAWLHSHGEIQEREAWSYSAWVAKGCEQEPKLDSRKYYLDFRSIS